VTNTAGIVLVWEGKALPAYCHSCCAGSTEDVREVWGGPPVPPLEGVECRWCASAKHFGPWNFVIGREKLARRLAPETGGVREIGRLRTAGETASGRVRWVMVDAGSREVRISGAKFRMLVGYNDLRSARFTITDRDDSVKFSGTGWGHGVGLCQEGACAMAKKGKSFTEIVRYYFPGTVLKRLKR
jgi:stage II sporulation protein D